MALTQAIPPGEKEKCFMSVKYLRKKIVASRRDRNPPRYGRCVDGYTVRRGAPTEMMVMLQGEKRWRRVMVWCFSNCSTLFLRIRGEEFVVQSHEIPEC